ncbi:tax1-binding protein 3 homolog isoform X2 [Macrobrachium rosenbergii]|uniref:tax1-binding protein 3 homolog isoform X2 n=1 Tax=Macrobrachium rosenbergii TaxID=79674 RepID=UPI0034D58556
MTTAFSHEPGTAMECLSIPITLEKETGVDEHGRQVLRCGFKIGGGIDQDFMKSPQGYTDNGIYCTEIWIAYIPTVDLLASLRVPEEAFATFKYYYDHSGHHWLDIFSSNVQILQK